MSNDSIAASTAPHSSRPSRIVGLVIDEGIPAKFAAVLAKELPVTLCQQVSNDVDWQVRVANDPIGLDENGGIPIVDLSRRYRSANQWHIAMLITELPMRLGTVPLVADYNAEHCVALVSLPALGAVRLRHRLCVLRVQLIEHRTQHDTGLTLPPGQFTTNADLTERLGSFVVRVRHIPSPSPDTTQHLAMVGLPGRVRMLAGSCEPIGLGAWSHRYRVRLRPPPPRRRHFLCSTPASGRWPSRSTLRGSR
jgi:hypothetical protein